MNVRCDGGREKSLHDYVYNLTSQSFLHMLLPHLLDIVSSESCSLKYSQWTLLDFVHCEKNVHLVTDTDTAKQTRDSTRPGFYF
jgi:hypothetical protein